MMHNIFNTNSGICKIYKTKNALLYMFTGLQCTHEFIDSEFVLPRCFKKCSYVLLSFVLKKCNSLFSCGNKCSTFITFSPLTE